MALYFDTYICPERNRYWSIWNAVPANIPLRKAFLNLTLVLGNARYIPVNDIHVSTNGATSSATFSAGVMKWSRGLSTRA
ncbi:hypothetical protein IMSAG192_00686 [Muribaculaceae bacterium]|nr:hypothetical protein IMSAG192_00686 [Muribaculaceae bacterium]